MNSAILMPEQDRNNVAPFAGLQDLIAERDFYRRQLEVLESINKLHNRLAGAIDLQSMMGAFSVWLMPIVDHALLAYDNPAHKKRYLFYSSHGRKKQKIMRVAESSLEKIAGQDVPLNTFFYEENLSVNTWMINANQYAGRLLILRENGMVPEHLEQYIVEGIAVLEESLQRGLEYEYLYNQARHDVLTGLANRRVFEERIGPVLENSRRHGRPVSILSMDLDRFKDINDTLGHAEGDKVLCMVSRAFSDMVRGSDLLVRTGGDEFLLLLPETDLEAAMFTAKRMQKAVAGLKIRTATGDKLAVSIGVAQWQTNLTTDALLLEVDEALYDAKTGGRNKICVAGRSTQTCD